MEKEFKVGDHVELISGGPSMTVRKFYANTITCDWFCDNKAYNKKFINEQLKHYEPPHFG